jgi:hypothetical protein
LNYDEPQLPRQEMEEYKQVEKTITLEEKDFLIVKLPSGRKITIQAYPEAVYYYIEEKADTSSSETQTLLDGFETDSNVLLLNVDRDVDTKKIWGIEIIP